MAVETEALPPKSFADWYDDYQISDRDGCLEYRHMSKWASMIDGMWLRYKREMDLRVAQYWKLEMLADGEVISPKPDLPNISSGETAGIVRRIARNLVQNTPNVEVISVFDDDDEKGLFTKAVLTTKIIGSDTYSNDMQQNLFASTKTAFTLGFDTVIPVLLQKPDGSWYIKYDAIHYRDVFPEPGAKDIRDSQVVFVRRYLSEMDVKALIRDNTPGWDIPALKRMSKTGRPPSREAQSVDHQTKKHHQTPEGYEIVTMYTSSGDPFLTFDGREKTLLRIERNKHPLKEHPVHFLVLEKDSQQPLGKSQVELLIGRQEFQDLMLNGAMKLWYRNINPSIIGYGTTNAVPNLSPGKYTQISNPNAKIEAFEVNTQTLMQYGQISQQNMGSMVNLVGSADQQMAQAQGVNGQGMSATPQGVEAQTAMVDITTNNYQKAIESFFSHYCSYALTIYFHELAAVKSIHPNADTRKKLLKAGMSEKSINASGEVEMDFQELAVEYFVRAVPGSLVELEDEKQMRILNQMFIPLSQSLPAIANGGDQAMMKQASQAMAYIIRKQIELSGSESAKEIRDIWTGQSDYVDERDKQIEQLESGFNALGEQYEAEMELQANEITRLREGQAAMAENMQLLLEKLGVVQPASEGETGVTPPSTPEEMAQTAPAPTVLPASA